MYGRTTEASIWHVSSGPEPGIAHILGCGSVSRLAQRRNLGAVRLRNHTVASREGSILGMPLGRLHVFPLVRNRKSYTLNPKP